MRPSAGKHRRTHRYRVTDRGSRLAIFLTRVHNRLIRPGLSEVLSDHEPDTPLRREFQRLDHAIEAEAKKHRLIA